MSSKATARPTKSKKPDPDSAQDPTLLLSIDYGTKTLSAAWRLAEAGRDPSEIHTVWFSTSSADAPQIIAWSDDGKFYWGWEAEHALKSKIIRREDTIELWKLALYKNHRTSNIAHDVYDHLERLDVSMHDLLATHLRAVVREAMKKIKQTALIYFSGDVKRLPKELLLSVPQMWKPPVNRIMVSAARTLGFQKVQLVYEPQCAVGYFAWLLQEDYKTVLESDDEIVVVDTGGGTGDFSAYMVKTASTYGPTMELELARPPRGALCGSEFVNREFLTWLKDHSEYKTQLARSGLSESAFLKEASAAFEWTKRLFHPSATGFHRVLIVFGEEEWLVKLTCDQMLTFFTPVLNEIVGCIDSQVTHKTEALLVPGGFGKSAVFEQRLQNTYGHRLMIFGEHNLAKALQQPVSFGALLRYKEIKVRSIPSSYGFGIAQVEPFDEEIHKDALYPEGGRRSSGLPVRSTTRVNKDIARYNHWEQGRIVRERWLSILPKGATTDGNREFSTSKWQRFVVKPGQESIDVQIYWTELDIAEHERIRTGGSAKSALKDGIEPWCDPIVLQLPDLKQAGFQLYESGDPEDEEEPNRSRKRNGKHAAEVVVQRYEIHVRFVMTCDGANISIKGQIAGPHQQLYDEHGEMRADGVEMLAAGETAIDIWEQDFSPSVRD